MSALPTILRTHPTGVSRRIMAGCQLRKLWQVDGKPMVVVEPLQFRPVRHDQFGDARVVAA